MKKRKLLTWKSTGKVVAVKAKGKLVELKEDRSLFARMMMVCKARPDIDLKEAIGKYEFSIVPRSMFAADGTMLHCSTKSSLMDLLEKTNNPSVNEHQDQTETPQMKVSITDAMAEGQALDKPTWIKNCCHLADHFTTRIFEKYDGIDELRLIFDRLVFY